MSILNHAATLFNKGYLYLGAKQTTAKLDQKVIDIAIAFVEFGNFVPGFADIVIVTVNKLYKNFKSISIRTNNCDFHIATVDTLHRLKLKKVVPDLLVLDTIHLCQQDAEEIKTKWSKVYTLYTGCKPNGQPTVITDTREQLPIYKGKECKRLTLVVGDYTTDRLYGKFHVERKSLQDLYGTIIQGHVRFRNELIRAQVYGIKLAMFIEGTRKNFINKKFPRGHERKATTQQLDKMLTTIEHRYGCEMIFCTSRRNLKKCMYERFKKEERKLINKK